MSLKIKNIEDKSEFYNIVRKNKLHFRYNGKVESGILMYEEYNHNMRIAYLDSQPVGCACSNQNYTCLVYVLPIYRRKGIGSALIKDMDLSKVDERANLNTFWKRDKHD